jgi:hypothetical protein
MTSRTWITWRLMAFVIAITAMVSGCANWSHLDYNVKAPERSLLQRPMPENVAGVEVMIMRMSPDQNDAMEAVWSRTNEQALPIELRRRLDQNGIRATVVESVIPLPLQSMIDSIEKRLSDDPFEQMGIGADIVSHSRLLQCRAGQRKEILFGNKRSEPIVLMHNHDGVVSGRSFDEPQLLFDLRAQPNSDESTLFSLVPEVQYGPLKQKFVSQEFGIRSESKRDAVQWTDVTIDQKFKPGQMLMITAALPPRGLGEHFFFTNTVSGTREQLLFLVRFSPNRHNSAFDAK